MIFALGSTGNLLSVSLLYLAIKVGSIVLLVRSFLRRGVNGVMLGYAVACVVFGLVLVGVFIGEGTRPSDDSLDWVFALIPLACGSVVSIRFICGRHRHRTEL